MKFCLITMSASLRDISPQLFRCGTKNDILLIYKNFFILSVYMDSHSRAALNNVATLNEVDMVSIFEVSKRFIQHFWLFYHSVCEAVREANFFHFFGKLFLFLDFLEVFWSFAVSLLYFQNTFFIIFQKVLYWKSVVFKDRLI